MTLKTGEKAPDFNLKDKDGNGHSLDDSTYTVVYFYPKDNTPGCTMEAREFNENLTKFNNFDTRVIGISGGNEKTKTKFCDKYNLHVLLLSDPDFSVSKKYKVYGKKKFMGKEYLGISRTTFILDNNKKIIKLYENVNSRGHAEEVLSFVRSL